MIMESDYIQQVNLYMALGLSLNVQYILSRCRGFILTSEIYILWLTVTQCNIFQLCFTGFIHFFVEKILWIQHQISNTSTATLMVCFFLINPTFNYVLFSLLLEVKSLIISGSWPYNSLTISILISVSLFYYVNFIHYFKLNCVSVMALRYDDHLLYMVYVWIVAVIL